VNKSWHKKPIGSQVAVVVLAVIPALLFVLAMPAQELTVPPNQGVVAARIGNDESPEPRLLLGFADRSGLYLANVQVVISDEKGNPIADLWVDGPWLHLELDPGTYHISASFEGKRQELRNVYLSERGTTTRVLYWDLKVIPTQMIAEWQADRIV
jgi:hypothetical protein